MGSHYLSGVYLKLKLIYQYFIRVNQQMIRKCIGKLFS